MKINRLRLLEFEIKNKLTSWFEFYIITLFHSKNSQLSTKGRDRGVVDGISRDEWHFVRSVTFYAVDSMITNHATNKPLCTRFDWDWRHRSTLAPRSHLLRYPEHETVLPRRWREEIDEINLWRVRGMGLPEQRVSYFSPWSRPHISYIII